MKQIEKNKETLWEDIEQLCNRPITRANAAELSTYMGALKAMCMICGEEKEEHTAYAREDEKPAHTPELDGDTEFERAILAIPMDGQHLEEVFKIFGTHMEQMEVVNHKAYARIIERLKEVARL